jgi:hypothetical protein
MSIAITSLLRDKADTILTSLACCILQSLYISFINRNHVLLYFSVSINFYVYFIVISLLSFHSENNLDQWYERKLLLIIFQCMSPTRFEYSKLGIDLVSLEENFSRMPKKPSMAE